MVQVVPPGNSNVNFTNSNLYDSLRGVHAVPSDTFQYSLVSYLPFFGDASSQSAFDGKQGRPSTSLFLLLQDFLDLVVAVLVVVVVSTVDLVQ